MPGMAALFLYDFNSPFAYLAALRIDDVLAGDVEWQPIAFAFLLRAQQRIPWSLDERRPAGLADIEQRAAARGLAPLVYPDGWPAGSYTLDPLRAALVAADHGLLREYSFAAFERNFVAGTGLKDGAALEVAAEVGLDPDEVRAAMDGHAKERLIAATDEAIAAGVHGVPTVTVDGEHFWGDDRLEEAAAALAR
jgi:2-hydroxychromene-2-carboxylate isomerase